MADETKVVLTSDVSGYERNVDQATRSTDAMLASVIKLTTAIDGAFKSAGRKLEFGGAGALAGITAAGLAAGRLDEQMSQLQASMQMVSKTQLQADQGMKNLGKSVSDLRTQFGQTSSAAVALTTQLAKMGQNTRTIDELSSSFTRLSAISGENINGLVDSMISLQRQMGTQGIQQTKVFNATLAELSANSGASAQGILSFAQSIAPVAKISGMTQKEIMGVSQAFVKSGADGYTAANAFNKMLTDITRSIQYGSPELKAYSNLIGTSIDEFKKMNRTEAITQIFEQINKQGPDAIKTLERFGLDGIRTYKSLQAVANQGGIRQAVSDAMGGGDQDKFNRSSNAALDGLNDELKKMSENGKQIAEAFGKGVLPVFEKFAKLINAVLSPVKGLLQEMDKIPGLATAALGLGAIGAGMVVKSFTGLSALGPAVGATRTLRQGYRSGRMDPSELSGPELKAFQNQQSWMMGQPAQGNWLQHRMYQGAAWMGGNRRDFAEQRDLQRQARMAADPGYNDRSVVGRGLSRAGIFTSQMAGGVLRAGLDPLSVRAMGNNFNRDQNLQFMRSSTFRDSSGVSQASYQLNRLRGMLGNKEAGEAAASAARLNSSLNTAANSSRQYSTVMQALRGESMALARAMASAAAGTTMMAGRGAMSMAGSAAGGMAGRAASGAMNFLGGPMGIALMGGTALYAGYQAYQGRRDAMENMFASSENTSPGATYAAALGEASRATRTFADVVRSQASRMEDTKFDAKVTDAEARLARNDKSGLTYSGFKGTNEATATGIASAVFAGEPSDDAKQLLKGDLLKTFGTTPAGRQQVERILNSAQGVGANPSRLNLSPLFSNAYDKSSWYNVFGPSDEAITSAQSTGDALSELYVGKNDQESARTTLVALNQALRSVDQGTSMNGLSRSEAVGAALGRGVLGRDAGSEDVDAFVESLKANPGNPQAVQDALAKSKTDLGRAVNQAISMSGQGFNRATTTMPSDRTYENAWSTAGMDDYVLGQLQGSKVPSGIRSLFNGNPNNRGISSDIYTALTNEGSGNAQWAGMKALADESMRLNDSFSGAIETVDQIKSAAGDASSALYQLANSAQGYLRQRQSEAMQFMSTSQRAGELRSNYDSSMRTYLNNPNSESGETLEKDRQAMVAAQADAYQRMKSLMTQVREFNISMERGEEDFSRSKMHSLEDYNRQREYSEIDFARQRQYAQDDFNLSRRRQEEDYNHSVVVMARNAAKSIMNIYERINVQRTWSASNLLQNMQDQQARLAEQQANLSRLRKAGLSGDAINQLGLNDASNAQQTARLTDDIIGDPAMIKKLNEEVQKRLKAARAVVTDKDNEQWQEMQRNFNKNMQRGEDDFERASKRQEQQFGISMDRNREQFGIQMGRMQEQYDIAMGRARDDLNRSQEEITGTFEQLAEASLKTLTGTSRSQLATLLSELGYVRGRVLEMSQGLMSDLQKVFASLGIDYSSGTPMIGGKKLMTGTIVLPNGTKVNAGQFAAGGEIPGRSPHSKADNIPIMATAGEFMQPVDSVQYYGRDFMEKVRTKSIPRNEIQHLASGGMVYQQMSDWVRKNLPGVAITSSYRPGAITALGNTSMHARGKALDLAPSMSTFDRIRSTFGSSIHQLFYSPADGRTILRGKPWKMDPVTKGDHWDHVHWAMESFTKGMGLGGGMDVKSVAKMIRALSSVKSFNKLMSGSIKPLQALGNNFLSNAMTQLAMSQSMGESQAGTDSDYKASAGGSDQLKAMVRSMASGRNWTGSNWTSLDKLIAHESSWNPKAQNPSSSAYGLFQFLDSTWKGVGGHKTSDPRLQTKYGLQYIANRYGNPNKAWDFWQRQSPHWYGDGGLFNKATQIGVGERGPEAVLPLNQKGADFFYDVMKRNASDAKKTLVASNGVPAAASTTNYYQRVDKSTVFTGDIKVQANDPDDMLRKLEAKKRMEALKGRK